MSRSIAIIGAGAAGCLCAYFLLEQEFDVTLFDKGLPLRTLLPTGGGRCNLAHAEYDFRELAKNYPRGEKFLYSVFSNFGTAETLETFEKIGINCYTQENGRIFPESNSAKHVRERLLKKIHNANIIREEVVHLTKIANGFKLKTNKAEYLFSDVVLATGGHSGYKIAEDLGIKIIQPKPSLVGLNTKESFKEISGTVVKRCKCNGF